MSNPRPLRCTCHGECRVGSRRRVCADPDLDGRCRGVQGQEHPRRRDTVEVRIDPGRGRAYCRDCQLAANPSTAPATHLDPYEMWTDYPNE